MLLKLGVDISRLKREVRRKLSLINAVFKRNGYEAVVTSTYEGNHSPGSLHYANLAIDLRTKGMIMLKKNILVAELKQELGTDFDVVLESNHIHIEYDPK